MRLSMTLVRQKRILTLFTILVMGLLTFGAVTAQDLVQPAGIVAYFTTSGDSNAIVTVNLQGDGAITQLQGLNGVTITSPIFSPDGTQIAFTGIDTSGRQSIWLMPNAINPLNAPNQARNITADVALGSNRNPSFAPDGQRLVVASNRDGLSYDIWLRNLEGTVAGSLVNLNDATANDVHPAWSPDGTKVAFTSNRAGNDDIWLYTFESDSVQQITTHEATDFRPAWSPDSTKLAFVSERTGNLDIFVVDVDDPSNQRNLTNHPADDAWAVWSADGNNIIFSTDRDSTQEPDPLFRLGMTDAEQGTPVILIADGLTTDVVGAVWQPQLTCPDNDNIVFETRTRITLAADERDATRLIFCNDTDSAQLYQYSLTLQRGNQEALVLAQRAHLIEPQQDVTYQLSNLTPFDIAAGNYRLCLSLALPQPDEICQTVTIGNTSNTSTSSVAVDGCQHVVRAGESLGQISSRYRTTVQAFLNANPNLRNANLIVVGQRLTIPNCDA